MRKRGKGDASSERVSEFSKDGVEKSGKWVMLKGRKRWVLTSSVERKILRYSLSSSVAYRSRREFLVEAEEGKGREEFSDLRLGVRQD